MKTIKTTHVVLALIVILGLCGAVRIFGPFDKAPRLRADATSPDQTLRVQVFQKRLSFFPTLRFGILVRVYDNQSNLLYDKIIFEDSWWNEDLGEMYTQIIFDTAEIKIGPKFSPTDYYVIRKSDLKGTGEH